MTACLIPTFGDLIALGLWIGLAVYLCREADVGAMVRRRRPVQDRTPRFKERTTGHGIARDRRGVNPAGRRYTFTPPSVEAMRELALDLGISWGEDDAEHRSSSVRLLPRPPRDWRDEGWL